MPSTITPVTVEKTPVILLTEGACLDTNIIMPQPTGEGFEDVSGQDLYLNIVREIQSGTNLGTDETIEPMDTKQLLTDMWEEFRAELFAACSDDKTQVEQKEIIVPPLDYAFPYPSDIQAAPNKVYSKPVVYHLVRVIAQTVFDRISPGQHPENTTHMSVDNPLAVTQHKWDEIQLEENTTNNANHWVKDSYGIKLHGGCFTEPVIMNSPDTHIVSVDTAVEATEELFREMMYTFNIGISQEFNSVTNTSILSFLNETIEQCLFASIDDLFQHTKDRIIEAVDNTLPETVHSELPRTIHCESVVFHITWMAIQSVLDELTEQETHMRVEQPFFVSQHKWDEALVGGT